jgi:hypothetical protein
MEGPRTGLKWSATLVAVAVATGLAAVSGVAGTSRSGGEPAPAAFRLEDGSAGCRLLDADTLVCRAAGSDAAAVLAADGSSHPGNVDVDWDDGTPVLLAAESWWHGPFSCRVRGSVVTCAAGDGAVTVESGALGGVR